MAKEQEAGRSRSKALESVQRDDDTSKAGLNKSLAMAPTIPEKKPLDPLIEAFNARFEEFKALDHAGQVALFTQTLNDAALMDHEMAFDMLEDLYVHSIEMGDYDQFDTLVQTLRQRLPEVYDHDAHYYLAWRISRALCCGRVEVIPSLAREIAKTAGRDIDTFNKAADQLAYHGQLSALVDAYNIAWPLVKESSEIVPWGIDEFSMKAGFYAIFDALEQGVAAENAADVMKSRIEVYYDVDPEKLNRYIAHIGDRSERHWTPGDFEFLSQRHTDSMDEGSDNLHWLSLEFLGYLRRTEGVSYTKGELARQQIKQYLLDRHAGKLEWCPSPLEAMLRPGIKSKKKPPPSPVSHGLCPDHESLDRYAGQLLNNIFPQRYKAAAMMELIPAWLRFLESHELIDKQQREKTLLDLRELTNGLLKAWEGYLADPALMDGLKRSQIE
jgi:hypothetical protein